MPEASLFVEVIYVLAFCETTFKEVCFMKWYWIVLTVYAAVCVLVGLISLFVKPLRIVFRGLLLIIRSFFDSLYIALIWWWLAIICLCMHKPVPKAWRF